MIADFQYAKFLDQLAVDVRGENGIVLTPWESEFLGSYLGVGRHFHFTDARRNAIDRMWRRYGAELNHPHPLDAVSARSPIPEADPSACQYLIKEHGQPQHRCNEPATCREPGRLRYCDAHGEMVQTACKKSKTSFSLVRLKEVKP